MKRATLLTLIVALGLPAVPVQAQDVEIFNPVLEKLRRGEPVVGGTVDTPDPDVYCAVANAGFDFTWIEMQHSPLTYSEVADMIEQPAGVEIIEEVANLEGVDVVFVASSDLGSFTGQRPGDAEYEALVTRVRDTTLAAGRWVGGPLGWLTSREGYSFFQGPSAQALIRTGGRVMLEDADPCRFLPSGSAPVPGEAPCP